MGDNGHPPPYVACREQFTVGVEAAFQAPAEEPPYMVVFEDDGETGYLYCLDLSRKGREGPIVDALHIYNVAQLSDRDMPCKLEVVWSGDHRVAALFINRSPHAVVNFEARQACCRTGYPPPREGGWMVGDHEWDEGMLEKLGL